MDQARAASPVAYVTPESVTPPTLIMHGSEDPFLPFAQSVSLYERLRACGKDVEFYCMKCDVHGEGQFDNEAVLDIVEEFVRVFAAFLFFTLRTLFVDGDLEKVGEVAERDGVSVVVEAVGDAFQETIEENRLVVSRALLNFV